MIAAHLVTMTRKIRPCNTCNFRYASPLLALFKSKFPFNVTKRKGQQPSRREHIPLATRKVCQNEVANSRLFALRFAPRERSSRREKSYVGFDVFHRRFFALCFTPRSTPVHKVDFSHLLLTFHPTSSHYFLSSFMAILKH